MLICQLHSSDKNSENSLRLLACVSGGETLAEIRLRSQAIWLWVEPMTPHTGTIYMESVQETRGSYSSQDTTVTTSRLIHFWIEATFCSLIFHLFCFFTLFVSEFNWPQNANRESYSMINVPDKLSIEKQDHQLIRSHWVSNCVPRIQKQNSMLFGLPKWPKHK